MTNETENTRLLRLYKLLWEQIKDVSVFLIVKEVWIMELKKTITHEESQTLAEHLVKNIPKGLGNSKNRKAFVQRMIKELENDK